jgi:hypothetical protein
MPRRRSLDNWSPGSLAIMKETREHLDADVRALRQATARVIDVAADIVSSRGDLLSLEETCERLGVDVDRVRERASEDDKDKRRLIEALSALELRHVVAVASPIDHKRQERARRKCLERLMPRLAEVGATQVWFESRSEAQDKKDRAMLAALRSCGLLDMSVQADFARPLDEPMLWVPDAVAGAVSAAWKGRNDVYKAMLGPIQEIVVAL